MANNGGGDDIRGEFLELLLQKVSSENYPSSTTLEVIEELLATPEDVAAYARVLMDKFGSEAFPSVPMMRRLLALF
jgi:hypothetical protein